MQQAAPPMLVPRGSQVCGQKVTLPTESWCGFHQEAWLQDWPGRLCGQAPQDGSSLAFCMSPVERSLLHPHLLSQWTFLISRCLRTCPRPQLVIALIFRSERLHYDSLSRGNEGSTASPGAALTPWSPPGLQDKPRTHHVSVCKPHHPVPGNEWMDLRA